MGSGGTPDTSDERYWSDEAGIPWVAIADMSDRDLIHTTSKSLTVAGRDSKSLDTWPVGTLLFSMYASLGHVAELGIDACTNQAILALVPNAGVHQSYLKRWFEHLRPSLKQEASSNTQDNLNAEKVRNLPALLPPLPEQLAIAGFLDRETAKIDALVVEQQRLIALLKEKRQAVISHAVTKGLNPDAPMKPSGIEWLGDVPAQWEVIRIARIFREAVDTGSDHLPILSVSIHDGVSDKELDEAELDRKVTRSDDRTKYKAVLPGDLAYNMMRAWQGAFGAVTVAGQVSPAYVVARPIRNVRTEFVESVLRTPQAVEQMRRHSRGITDFRLRLYWEEFKNIHIALPPIEEQGAILSRIENATFKFDALANEAEQAIKLLKERRSALISAAVTGQIDVRGAA